MGNFVTFNLVSAGDTVPGFSVEQVSNRLQQLMKISPEKAEAIVSGRRVLKKGLTLEQAEKVKGKLEAVGLATRIQRVDPPKETSGLALELEPLEDEAADESEETAQAQGSPERAEAANPALVTCPKCGEEQAKAEQCVGCGVYFHKLEAQAPVAEEQPSAPLPAAPVTHSGARAGFDETDDEETALGVKAIAAAAGAALLGALLWKFIAVTFSYELGVVAWGIGGAVGFAAAAMGARGQAAGVLCAVLVVCSIVGGKFLAVDTFKQEALEMIAELNGEDGLRPIYDEEMVDARDLVQISDDASLRQYLVDHNYSEAWEPDEVTREEIDAFNEYTRPRLMGFAANPPSYQEWTEFTFQEMSDLTTMDLLKDSFGILDILFLFFGVATAFRLGSGNVHA